MVPGQDPIARRAARMLEDWRRQHRFTGKRNEVAVIPCWETLPARTILLAGLGERKDYHPGRLRQAASSAARAVRSHQVATLACSLSLDRLPPPQPSVASRAEFLSMALQYGLYKCTRHFTSAEASAPALLRSLTFTDAGTGRATAERGVHQALAAGEALAEVRDLANRPANEASPQIIAEQARRMAARYGLSCRVMGPAELQRKGCGALLAVARGSANGPRLIILQHRGRRPRAKPVVLVGKTLTFDTGGISLKPAKGMEWMKYDKCGGMAVLAALLMAARLKLPQPVVGILAAAENMPGGNATRPGDIVRSRAGKTIEILNTDAEGRLVLADALALGAEFKPETMVDLATLTGASIVALGHVLSPVMGNRPELVEELRQAGEACGERLWPLPLLPDYAEDLQSSFADLRNIGEQGAGTIIGGMFLEQFVPKDIPWAHLDIANTAWEENTRSYAPKGATLFGAALLIEWLRQRAGSS